MAQHWLWKYLIPRVPLNDIKTILGFCVAGSLIAGTYGVLHDQVTYSIGPEYFTHFKFDQFDWANLQMGNLVFVSCIGFLATWWVGLICAWILSRRMLAGTNRRESIKRIWIGFGIIFLTTFLFGLGGYLYGLYLGPDADYSKWNKTFRLLGISDQWAFLRVAYIHNAGYLGGLAGLILTYVLLRPPIQQA